MNSTRLSEIFFLICLSSFFLSVVFSQSSTNTDTILNVSLQYYHIPFLYTDENLVKLKNYTITLKLWKQNTVNMSDKQPEPDAVVYGNLTDPDGIVYSVNFTSLGDGNYTLSFNFNKIGVWQLYIKAEKDYSYTEAITFIYVGRLPFTAKIISSTEYKSGEQGEVTIMVKDPDGNPKSDVNCTVRIYYPNKTLYSSGLATYFKDGIYYYNFTTPTVEGIYTILTNCSNSNFTYYDGKTFHISPWANEIHHILTNLSWVKSYLGTIETEIQNVNNIVVGFGDTYKITTWMKDYGDHFKIFMKVKGTNISSYPYVYVTLPCYVDLNETKLYEHITNYPIFNYEIKRETTGLYYLKFKAQLGSPTATKTYVFEMNKTYCKALTYYPIYPLFEVQKESKSILEQLYEGLSWLFDLIVKPIQYLIWGV